MCYTNIGPHLANVKMQDVLSGCRRKRYKGEITLDDAIVGVWGNLALFADGLLAMINSTTHRHQSDSVEAALEEYSLA